MTDMDVIVINSDSEDEAVPPVKPTILPSSQSSSSASSEVSTCKASATSNIQRQRSRMARRRLPPIGQHFPFIHEIDMQFRQVFWKNHTQSRVMKVIQSYISNLRFLQDEIQKFPNKCRLLSLNVCRTLLLLKGLSKHFADTAYYLQKIAELLSIYTFLELKVASGYMDSNIRIAERIVSNINLHLEAADVTYMLRIFTYIPYMGKDNDIVSKIFKRLIPEPLIKVKNEFNDRLYVQYLIAFYHWKDAEALYEDQQKVITFANDFMRPKKSLKSSLYYAQHLPSYEKRDDATSYFLKNMVFFNDLRNASLLDGIAGTTPTSMVDLSDEMDSLKLDCAEIQYGDMTPVLAPVKLEERQIIATVDLTETDDDAPWLTRLLRNALACKVNLPPIITSAANPSDEVPVIEIDSSDDELWAFNEEDHAAKKRNAATIDDDVDSRDSFPNTYNDLDQSVEVPEDSSDKLLKELTQETAKLVVQTEESIPNEINSSNERRLTFEGITNRELNNLPSSSSSSSSTLSSSLISEVYEKITDNSHSRMEVVVESSPIGEKEPIPDIISTSEMEQEISSNEKENNDTDLAEVTTSLRNELSDNACEEPMSTDIAIDNTEVEKEAVTLTLNTYTNTFESSDEGDDTFLTHYIKPPIKTYLRKAFKKSETSVVERQDFENNTKSNTVSNETPELDTNVEDTPNVLFSGKVIPLREDDNAIGGLTPSYLKVPESVEVSSLGSNVVFSMQGRRLSSFPALQLSSSNEPTMPDFDADFFNEAEEIVENQTKLVSGETKAVKSNIKSKDEIESEKPATKRRNVWFSDKTEIHEISPRENIPSPESPQSTINNITSTINSIKITKQQYQQPSTFSSSQPDINANQIVISTTSTNILKRTIPNTTPTTSPDTAALKSAQEQDLVQRLFPELFVAGKKQQNRIKLPKANNIVKAPAGKTTHNKSLNNNNCSMHAIEKRRKSVTPVFGRQSVSEFDKYLQNLQKKRTKSPAQPTAPRNNKRGRPRKYTNKVPVNVITKSLVDITNDVKLTKMRPVVVVNRISESIFKAKMFRTSKSVSVTDATLMWPTTQEICTKVTQTKISSMEYLFKLPCKESPTTIESVRKISSIRSETKSLGDILTRVVEEEIIAPLGKDKSLMAIEQEPTDVAAEKPTESLSIVAVQNPLIVEEKPLEDTVELSESEKMPVESETKPQVEVDPSKSELKPIKMEEPEAEPSTVDNFKKPIKSIISRVLVPSRCANGTPQYTSEFKASPASSFTTEVAGTSNESLADRLAGENSLNSLEINRSDEQLPPNTHTQELDTLNSPTDPTESTESNVPIRQVKVKLKRCDIKDSVGYVVVSNTATDDAGNDPETSKAVDDIDKVRTHDEKRHRKTKERKGSAAKKKEAVKRVYEKNHQLCSPRSRRNFIITENNPLLCINTPPPTPPSPSLSPTPQSVDTNPVTDDTSQDGSEIDSRKPNTETSNNNVQPSIPPLCRPNGPNILSNLLSSSSNMIQEFRVHANMPTEVEIDANFLALFYEYLVERKDDRAMEEINKIMPLLNTRLFDPSKSERQRRRFESCSLPSTSRRRTRKLSSSDSPSNECSWSSMASKRRKTICSDSHYLAHSPDLLFDEEICSSTKPADSPTIEVMRLHTGKRSAQPKPATIVSSTVTSEQNEGENTPAEIATDGVRSPHLFADCPSSTTPTPQILSARSTLIQSEIYMEDECANSSSRLTNSESTPETETETETSPSMVVSRTYSKNNVVVQHVFVPPEIEKCIEEQSPTVVEEDTTKPFPTPTRCSSRKARKIQSYAENFTSDDYESEKEDGKEKSKEVNATTANARRTRRKSKTSRRRKRLKKC